jgi:hypothetical protein
MEYGRSRPSGGRVGIEPQRSRGLEVWRSRRHRAAEVWRRNLEGWRACRQEVWRRGRVEKDSKLWGCSKFCSRQEALEMVEIS